jgi:hypothetical protein
METKIFDYKGNRVVVSFGVYGGGGNNRKVRYLGEKNIMDLISLRDGELFQREDGKYYSCNGDEMNMVINEDGLTGYIDFDGDYDTINACYFDELDEDSLKLIREDGAYIPSYMEEHIKNVLDKNNMSYHDKAVKRLESLDISAVIENDTVYVVIGDTKLELAEFEIEYQSNEYDKMVENGYEF